MSKSLIVGICGRAGSGKSSVTKHLVQAYGFEPISFAAPLKRMAMDIWGFSEEQVFGEAHVKEAPDPRTGITPRWAMQKLGQAARDHLFDNVWIDAAFCKLSSLTVIEDVRYVNEARRIMDLSYTRSETGAVVPSSTRKGIVLRLHCRDSISKDVGLHPSEAEVDQIPVGWVHAEIVGSREQGLEHLFGEVDKVIAPLLSP